MSGRWNRYRRGLEFRQLDHRYGDHMTMEEFIGCVKWGLFIDYDGYGYYATETMETNKIIQPSHVAIGRLLKFSHVMWYNR